MFFELALAAVPDFIKKGLLALGIGWLSYQGVNLVFGQVQASLVGMYQNIPSDIVVLCAIGGIPDCIGIVLGAMLARLSFMSLEHMGKVF